jgi:hypothetical protein
VYRQRMKNVILLFAMGTLFSAYERDVLPCKVQEPLEKQESIEYLGRPKNSTHVPKKRHK